MQTGALFPSLSGGGGVIQVLTTYIYQLCHKEWAGWCVQEDLPNNAISPPKLTDFWFIYLGWSGLSHAGYLLFCYFSLTVITRHETIISSQN